MLCRNRNVRLQQKIDVIECFLDRGDVIVSLDDDYIWSVIDEVQVSEHKQFVCYLVSCCINNTTSITTHQRVIDLLNMFTYNITSFDCDMVNSILYKSRHVISQPDDDGNSILFYCDISDPYFERLVLDTNINVNHQNVDSDTIIHHNIRYGDVIPNYLLHRLDLDLNIKNDEGDTPL